MKIILRKLRKQDLKEYGYWKLPFHKYNSFNGPYYGKSTEEELKREMERISLEFDKGNYDPIPNKKIITNESGALLGEVTWYWRSEETNWLELGLVIFDEENWNKGIGKKALKLWISDLFNSKNEIVRIGISTWSGNTGMVKLASKLGMVKEAEYRNARIVNGKYYDSVSYGLLREEWEKSSL